MTRTALALAFLAVSAAPVAAFAQQPAVPPNATVAYVSAQRLTNETNVGKQGVARLQAAQQQRQADLRSRQQALDATRQQLSAATDAGVRAALQQQEQQQRTGLERATAEAQAETQNLQRQAAAELQARLRVEIPEIIKGTAIQVIVQQETAIVWAAPGLDLTSALIERINSAPGTAAAGAPAK